MQFHLSEEQLAYQAVARQLAVEWLPKAPSWDEKHEFPIEALKKAAQLGFAAMYTRQDIGGSQLSRLDAALVFEELSQACVSTAAYLSIHNMVTWIVDTYGSKELRMKFGPKLAGMQILGSYCLTESNAGSDAASLKTQAVKVGNEYIVNGSKAFISGGSTSDIYICMVRTGEAGPKGITCLLIEKKNAGISFGKLEKKLGWHSQPTTMVFFENCKVPIEHRIGEEGQGFSIALQALNGGRVNIAACSLGGATSCLNQAKKYMGERKQFNKPLADFQALRFQLADAYTELEAAKLMTYRAAQSLDNKDPLAKIHCAMAKRYATEIGFKISNLAMQIFGGYGYLMDYPIERFFRDLRVHMILEGTNEIMKVMIANHLFEEITST